MSRKLIIGFENIAHRCNFVRIFENRCLLSLPEKYENVREPLEVIVHGDDVMIQYGYGPGGSVSPSWLEPVAVDLNQSSVEITGLGKVVIVPISDGELVSQLPVTTTLSVEPTTKFVEPVTQFVEPTTVFTEPTTEFVEPTTQFVEPTTVFTEPTTEFVEPTTLPSEPTTEIVELTTAPPAV